MKKMKLIIVGGGGHARSLINTILECGYEVHGIIESDSTKHGTNVFNIPIIGDDTLLKSLDPKEFKLINGLGSVSDCSTREKLFLKMKESGFCFETVISTSSNVSKFATIGEGSQILEMAYVGPGVTIEENVIVNTGAIVEHDCTIRKNTHIAPGSTICGFSEIGSGVHLGAGATVIQNLKIGNHIHIGAGSVVVEEIEDGCRVKGVPAKKY